VSYGDMTRFVNSRLCK